MATNLLLAEVKESPNDINVIFERPYREVGIRIRVDELVYIDTATQRYGANLMLDRTWLASKADLKNWQDLRDGKIEGQTLRDYVPDYHPSIFYVNCVSRNNLKTYPWEVTGGDFIIQKGRDGSGQFYNRKKITAEYEFTEEFEVANYPFDLQDLSIIIAPENATLNEQRLVPHHTVNAYFSINTTFSSITDWDIVDLFCKEYIINAAGCYTNIKNDYKTIESWANYKIQVKRRWVGIIYRVTLWMLLLGLLSFAMFGHRYDEVGDRLSYGITMVLTIVAFQFIITSSLPKVSYLTIIDKYNLFIFCINVSFIMESAILGSLGDAAQQIDLYFVVIAAVLFVLGHIAFAIYCYFQNRAEWEKVGMDQTLDVRFMAQTNSRQEFRDNTQ